MKLLVPFATLIALLASSAVFGAPAADDCQTIQAGVGRAICYDKRPKTQAELRAAEDAAKFKDPLEQMRLEQDKLSKRLNGICRGC